MPSFRKGQRIRGIGGNVVGDEGTVLTPFVKNLAIPEQTLHVRLDKAKETLSGNSKREGLTNPEFWTPVIPKDDLTPCDAVFLDQMKLWLKGVMP